MKRVREILRTWGFDVNYAAVSVEAEEVTALTELAGMQEGAVGEVIIAANDRFKDFFPPE